MTGCIESPSIESAAQAIRELVDRREWVVLVGECRVDYEGRGASRSTPGKRLIIIKPGHSVLVHGPRNFKPENWQPEGSSIHVALEEGELVILAVRRRPREVLRVSCSRVEAVLHAEPGEPGAFVMYMSEEEIRDALARHPDLIEPGLRVVERERPVPSGFVDLYAVDSEGRPVVVEIKRVRAGEQAVRQLQRYLEALRKRGVRARGILVAPGFTERAVAEAARRGIRTVQVDLALLRRMIEEESPRKRSILDYLGRG